MSLSKIGRQLTAVTMGIDRFERTRNDGRSLLDGEGLVPIFMGDDLVTARDYSSWEAAQSDLSGLQDDVEALPKGERKVFMEGMLSSLRLAVRLFSGGSPTFEEKVVDLVGAPRGKVDAAIIETARDNIDRLLAQAGFTDGSLPERVAKWEQERAVDPARLQEVFTDLMAQAKARTDEMIFDTGDYTMALNPVSDVPYTARCNFDDAKMDLNTDLSFTRSALKHLVCHEVYPGHSTQLLYTRAEVDAGRSTMDALLITANAITGCVQEGIGDQGVQLIDWIEDDDDQIQLELRRLRSAAQTTAAWVYMVEGKPAEEVMRYLREVAMGQEAWARGRLRMAAHPFRGPFIASYWAGNEAVRAVRERIRPEQKPDFLHALLGRAQSPRSLDMFPAE
ncbi:hypothetical protein [Pseudoroseicyclus aestuarii]|uniref:DUF885 domain-containing protein n=1 Tax=Pseudoroseicyclus aestuarii TaxID=1795041 RepID=A0A318T069_9RHOB|nr:hypothetical protein [Pseudoroseicyclus aestuarii]PYE82487.1 hypothetical protein DFP88_104243 [Pseudoroseicyclus aestuarii]